MALKKLPFDKDGNPDRRIDLSQDPTYNEEVELMLKKPTEEWNRREQQQYKILSGKDYKYKGVGGMLDGNRTILDRARISRSAVARNQMKPYWKKKLKKRKEFEDSNHKLNEYFVKREYFSKK